MVFCSIESVLPGKVLQALSYGLIIKRLEDSVSSILLNFCMVAVCSH